MLEHNDKNFCRKLKLEKFVCLLGVQQLENSYWIPFGEQAVNVIYKLAEHPDIICGDIIKSLAKEVIKAEQLNQTLSQGNIHSK